MVEREQAAAQANKRVKAAEVRHGGGRLFGCLVGWSGREAADISCGSVATMSMSGVTHRHVRVAPQRKHNLQRVPTLVLSNTLPPFPPNPPPNTTPAV